MSFSIYFYQNIADNKMVDKTNKITHRGTILLNNFRSDFDVMEPLLIIDATDQRLKATDNSHYETFISDIASGYINYFSISTRVNPESSSAGLISRYYYLVSYYIVNDKIIALRLHEDVLFTRKDMISDLYGIVSRNENAYNLLISDGQIKTYSDAVVRRKKFPTSFDTQNPTYFLTVASHNPKVWDSSIHLHLTIMVAGEGLGHSAMIWIPFGVKTQYNNTYINTSSYEDFVANPINNWCVEVGDDHDHFEYFRIANVSGGTITKYYFEDMPTYNRDITIPIDFITLPTRILIWSPQGARIRIDGVDYDVPVSNYNTAMYADIHDYSTIGVYAP